MSDVSFFERCSVVVGAGSHIGARFFSSSPTNHPQIAIAAIGLRLSVALAGVCDGE
ncbi:MAG: hypothetical protein FD121_10 [Gallionellaceae bacterium]|nr:MAG: hypothetical protein FD121_10 [Gallionellaceae bacterium]